MIIFIDKSLPLIDELFITDAFELIFFTRGDKITQHADIVICRAHTKIDQFFLNGFKPKVIATATSGIDHIDRTYLSTNNISLISANGCNAQSVCEYVLHLLFHKEFPRHFNKIGIIGVGNVGQRLNKSLINFNYKTVLYDPPKELRSADFNSDSLEELYECDVISIHVPLVEKNIHRTHSMIDDRFLKKLKYPTTIINTSRGEVLDEQALLNNKRHNYCLDVFNNEPDINIDVLNNCLFATPHIAGHAIEAKQRAIYSIYKQIIQMFNINALCSPNDTLLTLADNELKLPLSFCYDPMLETVALKNNMSPEFFIKLRQAHIYRREL